MLDSLVRVSRRVVYDHYASVRAEARSSAQAGRIAPSAIRRPQGRYLPRAFDRPPKPTLARPRGRHRHECRLNPASESGRKRFPFNNFTCFLTLFSKCFSSFDHSTCALSSCIPKQLDSSKELHTGADTPSHTGFSPSMTSRSRALRWGPLPKHPLQITMRTPKEPAFKFELLPLHSPLPGQSLLVSFPPLIDMLKFSGYPYLIRGQPG
ncbi:hypothetical protein N7530_010722 [Penicillium desertorum]|uniref:Uncharacterized protein n=1 Tax=Penicillium desertorum TaxID=1303715 RepID=A0A9X0BGS5_9EURO|nr:hypothetical protein N7530_010722 [Penicillium desertorum]